MDKEKNIVNENVDERIAKLESEVEYKTKYYIQYMRQVDILKAALDAIVESGKITRPQLYEAILVSSNLDLDSLLVCLSR